MNHTQRYLALRTIAKHAVLKPKKFETHFENFPKKEFIIEDDFDSLVDDMWEFVKKLIPKSDRERVENSI